MGSGGSIVDKADDMARQGLQDEVDRIKKEDQEKARIAAKNKKIQMERLELLKSGPAGAIIPDQDKQPVLTPVSQRNSLLG